MTAHRWPALIVAVAALSVVTSVGWADSAKTSGRNGTGTTSRHACVKKGSGEVRVVSRKRQCKRGWGAIQLAPRGPAGDRGATGATGPQGPPGPLPVVVDNHGVVLGRLLGADPSGLTVLTTDKGLYRYGIDGAPSAAHDSSEVVYIDNRCDGEASAFATPSARARMDSTAGGYERWLQSDAGRPAAAYALGSGPAAIDGKVLYNRDETGACQRIGARSGLLYPLMGTRLPMVGAGPIQMQATGAPGL